MLNIVSFRALSNMKYKRGRKLTRQEPETQRVKVSLRVIDQQWFTSLRFAEEDHGHGRQSSRKNAGYLAGKCIVPPGASAYARISGRRENSHLPVVVNRPLI